MKKRLLLVVMMTAVMLCGCQNNEKKNVTIGTGGAGGNYYSYGLKMAEALSQDEGYSLEVQTTQGSKANIRLLSQGFVDMALVQSDIYVDAVRGTGVFEGNKLDGFHAVADLYGETCQIVVGKSSGIASIDELAGKKVAIGETDSGVVKNATEIFIAYGVMDKITPVYMSFEESATALKAGEIDAFVCTSSYPNTAISELSKAFEIRLLPIDISVIRRLNSENNAYSEFVIPANIYNGQGEAVTTIGVKAMLVASNNLPKEFENKLVNLLELKHSELEQSFGTKVETEEESNRLLLKLDMYTTLALAVMVVALGAKLKRKVRLLEKFCIPAPVIGGLLFAILSCILYVAGFVEFQFDETLKNICMMIFFTSVGYQANIKVLKQGGISLVIFLVAVIVLIVSQNALAVGISSLIGLDPLVGMCTGSIPMVGGHGTAGAFGVVLEDLGVSGAITLSTAAATFGLIMGSLLGGPIGRRRILKHQLLSTVVKEDDTILKEDEKKHHRRVSMYAPAAYQLAIAMGIGTIISMLLSETGMTFPSYIGAMIVAAVIRNVGEISGGFVVHMGEINDLGSICLSMFLGIAMITLKIWQLAELALPLVILLLAQTILMFVFAYFVIFNIMGRNYDAAVLSSGTCGFGMGATPNAMANMQAITEKFAPSVHAYLLVPIVGSMFADFINSIVITFFINML